MVFHFVLVFLHVWLHVDFLGCCFYFVLILSMLVCLMRFSFCCMHVGFVSRWMFFLFRNLKYCLVFCVLGCLWMFFCGVDFFSRIEVFVSCMFTLFHIEYCLCCFHFLYVDFFCRRGVFVLCMVSFILQIWNVVWFVACLVGYGFFWNVLVICCLWIFACFLLQTCFLYLCHFVTTLLPLFACIVLHFCMFTCIWVCQLLILEACNIVWFSLCLVGYGCFFVLLSRCLRLLHVDFFGSRLVFGSCMLICSGMASPCLSCLMLFGVFVGCHLLTVMTMVRLVRCCPRASIIFYIYAFMVILLSQDRKKLELAMKYYLCAHVILFVNFGCCLHWYLNMINKIGR